MTCNCWWFTRRLHSCGVLWVVEGKACVLCAVRDDSVMAAMAEGVLKGTMPKPAGCECRWGSQNQ